MEFRSRRANIRIKICIVAINSEVCSIKFNFEDLLVGVKRVELLRTKSIRS